MKHHQQTPEEIARRKAYQERSNLLASFINPVPQSNYHVDVELMDIEWQLQRYTENYNLNLNPDFQRGFVWTLEQQIAYIEAIVRDAVNTAGRTVTLSCAEMGGDIKPDSDLKDVMLCIDGLQRLTALRDFVAGKFKVFQDNPLPEYKGGMAFDDFNNSSFSLKRKTVRIQIFYFQYRRDVLNYYIALNSGGTAHPVSEIERVKQLLNEC